MFVKLKQYRNLEVEWDNRQSMAEGTTGRLRVGDKIVEFEQHRQISFVKVANEPLFHGEESRTVCAEWYTVGEARYESFDEMITVQFPDER